MKKAIEDLIEDILEFRKEIQDDYDSKDKVDMFEIERFSLQMIVELQKILLDDLNASKQELKVEPEAVNEFKLTEWTIQLEGKYHSKIKLRSDIQDNIDEYIVNKSSQDPFSVFNIFKDSYFVQVNDDLKVINLSLKPDEYESEELFKSKKVSISIWTDNQIINTLEVDENTSDEDIVQMVKVKEALRLVGYSRMGIPIIISVGINVFGYKYVKIEREFSKFEK